MLFIVLVAIIVGLIIYSIADRRKARRIQKEQSLDQPPHLKASIGKKILWGILILVVVIVIGDCSLRVYNENQRLANDTFITCDQPEGDSYVDALDALYEADHPTHDQLSRYLSTGRVLVNCLEYENLTQCVEPGFATLESIYRPHMTLIADRTELDDTMAGITGCFRDALIAKNMWP